LRRKIKIYTLLAITAFSLWQCNQQPKRNSQSKKVDLFKEVVVKNIVLNTTLSPDSAFINCTVSGIGTNLKLIDSTVNPACFLYSAFFKNSDKGAAKWGKTYFIAFQRLLAQNDTASYRLYLVPLENNNIIKKNLAITWQWCPRAPLFPSP